jgi:D-glycero-D-manno-heptose 1,7-bisphosphate phosphatase
LRRPSRHVRSLDRQDEGGHRAEDLVWIDDAPAAVRLLNRAGYYVVVVTNQGGVARGFYDEGAIDRLHEHMQSHLIAEGAHIDAFYHCPHHPEGSVLPFAIECLCRKPGIGMLEQAARDWPIDRTQSFMVGDRDGDMEAAAAFQIPGLRFDAQTQSLLDLISRQLAEKA